MSIKLGKNLPCNSNEIIFGHKNNVRWGLLKWLYIVGTYIHTPKQGPPFMVMVGIKCNRILGKDHIRQCNVRRGLSVFKREQH